MTSHQSSLIFAYKWLLKFYQTLKIPHREREREREREDLCLPNKLLEFRLINGEDHVRFDSARARWSHWFFGVRGVDLCGSFKKGPAGVLTC